MKLTFALIITLTPETEPVAGFGLLLPSEEACIQALSTIHDKLNPHYPSMESRCIPTGILWSSPIPPRRPPHG